MLCAGIAHVDLASNKDRTKEISRLKGNMFVTYEAKVLFLSPQGISRVLGPDCSLVKDKILCFVCAVSNIERTFNTYYELQDHLYRDHDMKKDPAMDIFNKYRTTTATDKPAASQS